MSLFQADRDGRPPSKRMLFEETRKRKEERNYKKSYEDTFNKISNYYALVIHILPIHK